MSLEGKARDYRERAEELRAIAADFRELPAQQVLARLATDYERMALGLEGVLAPPSPDSRVRDYRFLIFDMRYANPMLKLVQATNADKARSLAALALAQSASHLAVEVWENDELLFTLGHWHD
jgi:hypothetical protein